MFQKSNSKDADQPAQMRRLVRAFVVRIIDKIRVSLDEAQE